jgi:hypothetical protein
MTANTDLTTLSSVLEQLRIKKQDNEFRWDAKKKNFCSNSKNYNPDELVIIKTYRFEGASDPGDNSILYLIEGNDGSTGYTMDAYGVYSNNDGEGYDDFIRKIPVQERTDQQIFGE